MAPDVFLVIALQNHPPLLPQSPPPPPRRCLRVNAPFPNSSFLVPWTHPNALSELGTIECPMLSTFITDSLSLSLLCVCVYFARIDKKLSLSVADYFQSDYAGDIETVIFHSFF